MANPLIHLKNHHLAGQIGGMVAVCSSHPMVLGPAMELATAKNQPLLIEATANQVNQFGGYTGMTPADFSAFIRRLADSAGLPFDRIIIGADHLGPHVWKRETARTAMHKATELATLCVAAGFGKIHLDTATRCADDPGTVLPTQTIAERAAALCLAAEAAACHRRDPDLPLYVIGNEVPPPGGGLEDNRNLVITRPEDIIDSLAVYEKAFQDAGLASAWQRVVAVVVQPGVEFGDRMIAAYDRDQATALSAAHARLPAAMTFEIHATDYQSPDALKQMVQDHFILLKAGPCLTFAFREAVYALTYIEDACSGIHPRSHLRQVMTSLMNTHPRYWQSHYSQTQCESLDFLKTYSFRDRIRYYWAYPEAVAAYERLIRNLSRPVPDALLRQFFPDLYPDIASGVLEPDPQTLIKRRIRNALEPYANLLSKQHESAGSSIISSGKSSMSAFIAALLQPDIYDHPVRTCELLETHASWVILTGTYAYKIKKPVNLGFLDFSTLEKRRFCCEEELRLNRRLAPGIYLELAPIYGSNEHPRWTGGGTAIEYAVKMVQFPQESQLDRALEAGNLEPWHIDAFAGMIARFHQQIAIAGPDSGYGDLEHVQKPVRDNFFQIRRHVSDSLLLEPLDELEDWTRSELKTLEPVLIRRKSQGFIRECHGDLHLRNLAWIDDTPVGFDCIEFNPNLRWIDVISDAAFLVMDLQDRRQPRLARRFLNQYLEHTGDYAGLSVLPFYLTYRALVRAKVNAILAGQSGIDTKTKAAAKKDCCDYLMLAKRHAGRDTPQLIITHGMSASGKSTVTGALIACMEAIRIRSDVERKRMYGMQPEMDGHAAAQGIYTEDATRKTYDRLAELSAQILDAGYSVIVDAAFLQLDQRRQFQQLAAEKHVPFRILDCVASPETLRRRIVERPKTVSDADSAVLEYQIRNSPPLTENERSYTLQIDMESPVDDAFLMNRLITSL
jgi:D-tagatose-bisphosphate aldolase class II non-catalytic subunit